MRGNAYKCASCASAPSFLLRLSPRLSLTHVAEIQPLSPPFSVSLCFSWVFLSMWARSNAASGEEIIKFLYICLNYFFFLFFFHQSFSGDSTPTHKLTEKKRKKNKNKLTQICSIKIYKRETLTGQLMVTQLSGCWVVCLCVCISLKLSWDGFVEEDRGEWIRCVLQRVYSLRIV